MSTQLQPVARNAVCPCGSGRRFKACCGSSALPAGIPALALEEWEGEPGPFAAVTPVQQMRQAECGPALGET